jgi:hypothetical protein
MKLFEVVGNQNLPIKPLPIEIDTNTSTNYPPDGEYDGVMGGYNVSFQHAGHEYRLHTETGVRGMNIPCIVKIVDQHIKLIY